MDEKKDPTASIMKYSSFQRRMYAVEWFLRGWDGMEFERHSHKHQRCDIISISWCWCMFEDWRSTIRHDIIFVIRSTFHCLHYDCKLVHSDTPRQWESRRKRGAWDWSTNQSLVNYILKQRLAMPIGKRNRYQGISCLDLFSDLTIVIAIHVAVGTLEEFEHGNSY